MKTNKNFHQPYKYHKSRKVESKETNTENKIIKATTTKQPFDFLSAKDKKALNSIRDAIKDKINQRIQMIKDETGEQINHVSINYFNTSALHSPTAMYTADYIDEDKDNNIKFLCVMVYFGEHQLNQLTANTMIKFIPDKHVWRKSSTPNEPSIDLNGIVITDYNPVKAGMVPLKPIEPITPNTPEEDNNGNR